MSTSANRNDTSKIDREHSGGSSTPKRASATVTRTPSISGPLPLRPTAAAETNSPSTPAANNSGKGKRKADEVEGNTPPDARKQKATFAADPRPHRGSSTSSHAPSSFIARKRARLSVPGTSTPGSMTAVGETEAVAGSRPSSRSESQAQNAGNTGTWNSTKSRNAANNIPRAQSRASHRSLNPSHARNSVVPSVRAPSRRGSISQASIPISALISPHAPSLSHARSSTFHMRDPRKPPKVQSTPWSLAFPQPGYFDSFRLGRRRAENPEDPKEDSEYLGWLEGGGTPIHGFLFFIGFILFPVWWIASFLKIPRTRSIEGGHDGQKSVVLDDPQVEHDASSWRRRCRVMSIVSLVTYVPFIILVAIFA